jgi:exosortase E/protease (VPEID-CTERM system)
MAVAVARVSVAPLPLIALVVVELLYLTVRFDSYPLDQASSAWLRFVAHSPQYLRLAVTVAVVGLLLGGWREFARLAGAPGLRRARLIALGVHAVAAVTFFQISTVVFDVARAGAHPAWWVSAWLVTGAVALGAWIVALAPELGAAIGAHRGLAAAGLALGGAAWFSGVLTEALWRPLAGYTFAAVAAMLGALYPQVVSEPGRLVLGTPGFKVAIAPSCSGYEGIGLILAFLTIYLWVFRRELRFPIALLALPIGAIAIWVVNALRIVALIALGEAGWREIALGGFHSQAGWIAFNVVGLAFVAVLNQGRYFRREPSPTVVQVSDDGTTAYLAPFLVVLATAMVTGIFASELDWLYPVRVIAAMAVLWCFRRHYSNLGWSVSWRAVAIGCMTFALWIALVPSRTESAPAWPAALASLPAHWAAAWLAIRVIGYTVTVPLVEELAFRGYLMRRLIREDFSRLPVGLFTWSSFLLSSVLFGALHGGSWVAGTLAGMTFAIALYQRRAIGDAVVAHATTNGLIAMYVFATGRWSVWG